MKSPGDTKEMVGSDIPTLPPAPSRAEDETLLFSEDQPVSALSVQEGDRSASFSGNELGCFGNYELISEIARGGMGVVYRARQTNLNRVVALKMILAGQLASAEDIQRFHTEAEAIAQLDHPGIVPVFDVGQHESQHFFSMGFVEGESLEDKIRSGPLDPTEAAKLCIKVAEAIAYAHEKGVIHRDLKPANILLDQEGVPKVTDFGLAKQVESDSDLTRSGTVMGTPAYMPPEQACGDTDNIGQRADVYSLGAVLYCLLTGHPPFQTPSSLDTLMQVLNREPVSPQELNPQTPRDLNTITLKCLEKSQDRRYRTAQELADDLTRFVRGEPILARSVGRTERTWRWCKRNPVVASLITLTAASLIAAAIISSYFAAIARNEAAQAKEARQVAVNSQRVTERALEKSKVDEQLARNEKAKAERYAQQAKQNADEATRYLVEAEEQKRAAELAAKEANRLNELSQAMLDRSNNFDISPNGKLIAQGFRTRVLVLVVSNGKRIRTLRGHQAKVLSVTFGPNGSEIFSGDDNGVLKVWDPRTGAEVKSLSAHEGPVRAIAAGGNSAVATAGKDGLVIWDVKLGTELLRIPDAGDVLTAEFSRDGQTLISQRVNGTFEVWDVKTGEVLVRHRTSLRQ